jgi:hypothetical protein
MRFSFIHALLLFFAPMLFAEFSIPTFLTRADAAQARGQHFLLTYARSGTNLTSCYLQYLTGKPIKFLFDENTFLAENRLNIPLDYSKPILYRTHYAKDMKKIDNRNNKLLYVLRNFKECILRHNYLQIKSSEEFQNLFKKNDVIVRDYMKGLEIYNDWEPSMRLLVHYEDLLTDPVSTMAQILAFFEEPIPAHLTAASLKEINAKTLASYHKQHKNVGGSHSKGEDLLYHTRDFPLDVLRDIDASVESNYPVLWTNYLKKYQS